MAASRNAAPKLTAAQESKIFDAIAAIRPAQAMGRGERRRFTLGLKRQRVRERFIANAYAKFLDEGGRAGGDMAEFVKWLLAWIVDNQDTILKLIMAIVGIFV